MIYIIGLGYGEDSITLGSLKIMMQCSNIYLRSNKLSVAKALDKLDIKYKTFDPLFESAEDFDQLNRKIAETILTDNPDGDTVYAVSSLSEDSAVGEMISSAKTLGRPVSVIPGVSNASRACATSFQTGSIYSCCASDFIRPDIRVCTVITEVDSPLLASDIKCMLLDFYPPDHGVYLTSDKLLPLALSEIDRQKNFSYDTCLVIPPLEFVSASKYDFSHLLDIMHLLRGENGCPWDREQTHESIRENMLEEALEAIEAIEANDSASLCDELGDVLLQVVFHAEMANEADEFNINDVIDGICKKLIRRHPHIFGDVSVADSKEVLKNWNSIKMEEKHQKSKVDVLRQVSKTLPALMRAVKLQKKAGCPDILSTEDFVSIGEQLSAIENSSNKEELFGELLFSVADIGRKLGCSPEICLDSACRRFIDRFDK